MGRYILEEARAVSRAKELMPSLPENFGNQAILFFFPLLVLFVIAPIFSSLLTGHSQNYVNEAQWNSANHSYASPAEHCMQG